jgi:signal transduction histidine kinase
MSARLPKSEASSSPKIGRRFLFPWRSLTWQLIFVTILPLTILVLAIAFGSLTVHQKAMRTLVGQRDERAARTAAAALDEQVNHRVIDIQALAQMSGNANSGGLEQILASSDYFLTEFDGGLAFFTTDGHLENASGDLSVWQKLADQITPLIRDQLQKNNTIPYLSQVIKHPVSGDSLVVVLTIASSSDQVAAGLYSINKIVRNTLTDAFSSGPQASIVMLDSSRRVLYASGSFSNADNASDHPGVNEALQGESGTIYVKVGGSEHVVAFSPIPSMGWALVMEEPWDRVATPTLNASQMAPFVLVPVLILAMLALWFGARRIVKPLQTLESRAATLALGDFRTIEKPVGGIEEIRQLQNELILMARKVQAAQQSLHGYIGAITAAQEEERRRLARELHDDTIQALIALKQRVQLTQLGAPHSDPDSAELQEIATLTEQTIENLRRLTRALRPIYLEDLGLVPALEMLVRETEQATNISVEFQRQGTEERLNAAVELAIYRISQEALSNITRHAQASHASLNIAFTPQHITMQVTDNGIGFDVPGNPAEFAPAGHYGLLGLYERAELIGAKLEIHSSPGKGTHLTLSCPSHPLEKI